VEIYCVITTALFLILIHNTFKSLPKLNDSKATIAYLRCMHACLASNFRGAVCFQAAGAKLRGRKTSGCVAMWRLSRNGAWYQHRQVAKGPVSCRTKHAVWHGESHCLLTCTVLLPCDHTSPGRRHSIDHTSPRPACRFCGGSKGPLAARDLKNRKP